MSIQKRFRREQTNRLSTCFMKPKCFLNLDSTVGEVCRKLGISEQPYYRWLKNYGGMTVDQAKCLKELDKENARRKS